MKRPSATRELGDLALWLVALGAFCWFTAHEDFYPSLFFGVMLLAQVIEDATRQIVRAIREKSAGDVLLEALRRPPRKGRAA